MLKGKMLRYCKVLLLPMTGGESFERETLQQVCELETSIAINFHDLEVCRLLLGWHIVFDNIKNVGEDIVLFPHNVIPLGLEQVW